MALIKCPECGKEVSDKAKNCIHCGYPIDIKENESNTKNSLVSFAVLNKKIIVIGLLLIVIAVGLITIIANSFSAEEKYALKMVNEYHGMLKNPDSLVLRSDIVVVFLSRDGKVDEYVFFEASGENGYGASVRSIPCFVNGKYLCDSDEIPSIEEYMTMTESETKKYLGLELALATWRLYGEDASDEEEYVISSYSVSAEKVAKKLKVESKVN